jgi:hypothetical protein
VASEILLLSNASLFALRLGEWDWIVDELETRAGDALATKDRVLLLGTLSAVHANRGRPGTDALEEIRREAAHGDFLIKAELAWATAAVEFAEGRPAAAAANWVLETEIKASAQFESLPYAGRAAAWARDAGRAADLLRQLEGLRLHGAVTDFDKACMATAVLALAGRPDEAGPRYAECLSVAARLGLRWDQALLGMEAAMFLGPRHPVAAAALENTRRIIQELGAQPFLDRLEALVEGGTSLPSTPALTAAAVTTAG